MEQLIKYIARTRALFVDIIDTLTIEQLNAIPEGFNNNIAWNFGHIIVSTEGLCYLRSGVQPGLKIPFGARYTKGSKPEIFIEREELEALKQQSLRSLEQIRSDLERDVFKTITPYATQTYGFEMQNIEEILTACLAHESLHYGTALALKKQLSQ